MKLLIFIGILALFQVGCTEYRKVQVGNETFFVEIADTPDKRDEGLMNRWSLDSDKGMLFVFEYPQPVTFWMKNTRIPLDIIFIGKENKLFNVTTANPCTTEPCAVYHSLLPVNYVLEIRAGESSKRGIKKGDVLVLPFLN